MSLHGIALTMENGRLVAVELPARPPADLTPDALRAVLASLAELPIQYPANASQFLRRVWEALREIPFGQTRTYAQIARQIGHPHAARAVGGACAANWLLLAVPCHRVVAAGGGLGGFALGREWKRTLLQAERANAATATSRV